VAESLSQLPITRNAQSDAEKKMAAILGMAAMISSKSA
jgi:hypothetical protein